MLNSRTNVGFTRLAAIGAVAAFMTTALGVQAPSEFYVPKSALSPYQVDQKDPGKAPKVYTIPIRGQLGTDVISEAYEPVFEDVREKKPDLIVYVVDCADINHRGWLEDDDPEEFAQYDHYDIRKLVLQLKEELKDIPQVVWVKDAVGMSAVIPFAWSEMYMQSSARLLGLHQVSLQAQHPDFEVQRKFLAARVALAAGFLEAGGYDAVILGEAMTRPERKLSVSWEGRKLIWRPDEDGTYVVDSSDEHAASFNAKSAEDLMLSKGTADDLDDLIFLLGYREWDKSLVEKKEDGAAIIDEYINRWREGYTRSREYWNTYRREIGWSGGDPDEAIAHLGKARKALQDIIDIMKRYPAVEARWKSRRSGNRLDLITVEQLLKEVKQQITAIERARQQGRRSGGGGTGGGSGSGGRGLGR